MNKHQFWGIVALVFIFGLLALIFTSYAFGEAQVLPQGTVITEPDGSSQTLDASHFLLDRTDMEQATLAIAAKPIDEKTIADLRTLSDKQAKDAADRGTVEIIGGLVIAVLAALLGHAVR